MRVMAVRRNKGRSLIVSTTFCGVEQRQLAGFIFQRSQVRVLPPQPKLPIDISFRRPYRDCRRTKWIMEHQQLQNHLDDIIRECLGPILAPPTTLDLRNLQTNTKGIPVGNSKAAERILDTVDLDLWAKKEERTFFLTSTMWEMSLRKPRSIIGVITAAV